MITRVGMAPRAAGLSLVDFQARWRAEHARAAIALPGLQGYVQNHAVLEDACPVLPATGFDACAETDFEDLDVMDAAFASAAYRGPVVADEELLIDRRGFLLMLTARQVLADHSPPHGAVKLITFTAAEPAADDALAALHAAVAAHAGDVRHEQLRELPGARARGHSAPWSVMDVVWLETPALAAAIAREVPAAAALTQLVARPNRVL